MSLLNYTSVNIANKDVNSAIENFKTVQIFLYCAILLMSVAGNGTLFFIMYKRIRKKNSTNFMILILSIEGLGVSLSSIPFDIIELEYPDKWLLGQGLCKLLWPIQTLFFTVLVWTLLLLSVVRYKEVCLRSQPDLKKTKIAVMITWFGSTVTIIPYMAALEIKEGLCTETWPDFSYRKTYTVFLFIAQYVIPLTVITVCYTCVVFKLKNGLSTFSQRLENSQILVQHHIKLTKMIFVMVLVFAVAMLPHHIIWLLLDFDAFKQTENFQIISKAAYLFMFASIVANPIIFGTQSEEFIKELKVIFRKVSKSDRLFHQETLRRDLLDSQRRRRPPEVRVTVPSDVEGSEY